MSPSAARLAGILAGRGGRRVPLEAVWAAAFEAEPRLVGAPGQREELARLIGELHAAGVVEPARRALDRSARPHLPMSVTFLGAVRRQPRPIVDGARFPWRPELAWAGSLRLTAAEFDLLQSINAFLRDGRGSGRPVPVRERSLQLTRDEKRLEGLLRTRLFLPGRLSLQLLGCVQVHPPFVWRAVGSGDWLLVVENHQTYHSLCDALPSGGRVGRVAYGAGNNFAASVTSVLDLDPVPLRVLYFGDLDVEGLQIPFVADRVAAAIGVPRIEPATVLYRTLLEVGTPVACARPAPGRVRRLVRWLPPEVAEGACRIIESGHRIAQEWVGLEVLMASDLGVVA